MDIKPPNTRPSRERKAPERIEVDQLRSRATGTRRPDSCCSCSEPTTSDESAAPNVVKLHQLRDSAQKRTIINNIDELAAFLEANFKNPTKSCFAKKGGRAIYSPAP